MTKEQMNEQIKEKEMDNRKKILIVDDELINLEFFDLMLSKLGFVVEKAEDGEEALEVIKKWDPDLIMLDNIMPKMSGWEVTKLLKTSPEYGKWRDIPIIMFSAMDDVKDKIEGFDLGIDDYITKPFNFSEVIARMMAVLRNHEMIIQLKNRETRLEMQESVCERLENYIKTVMPVLENVCNNTGNPEENRAKLLECKKEYDEIQKEVAGLQEEVRKLKCSEKNLDSLVEEIRKPVTK